MRIGKHLFANKIPPSFVKRGEGEIQLVQFIESSPNPFLQKRGFFYDVLLLVVLLEIYLRELRTESIYLPLKYPLFRKEGVRGRFN